MHREGLTTARAVVAGALMAVLVVLAVDTQAGSEGTRFTGALVCLFAIGVLLGLDLVRVVRGPRQEDSEDANDQDR